MPEPVFKSETPEYLSHYGMHRAPFLQTVESDMVYLEPTRVQRLDILLHLAQYGDELLLVTGPSGMGKTTFMHQFLNRVHASWKICQFNAYPMMPEEQLLQHINKGLNLPNESNHINSGISNLKKRIDAMLASTQTIILVVDNAHLLPKKTLGLLLDIANTRNLSQGTALHTILFCEPVIKILMAAPELENSVSVGQRKLELTAFDEKQTGEYLRHRLSVAGMIAERFVTPTTISKIYKLSEGIPYRINEVADQLLFETTPIIRRTSNAPKKPRSEKKGYTFAVGIVAICVIVFILVFQQEINAVFSKQKQTATASTTTSPKNQRIEQLSIPSKSEQKTDSSNNIKTSPLTLQKPQSGLSTEEKLVEMPQQLPSTRTATGSQSQSNDKASSSANVIVFNEMPDAKRQIEKPVQQKDATKNSASAQSKNIDSLEASTKLKTEEWLLKQNPDFYTLQLVSGHHKSTVINFIEKHQITSNKIAYYYTHRNGKNWHNLVYGIYADRQAAHKAIAALPPSLNNVKPWVRQLESIQIDIYRAQR